MSAITKIAGFMFVLVLVFCFLWGLMIELEAERVAEETLRFQKPINHTCYGVAFQSNFDRSEYVNTATVMYCNGSKSRKDYNKSKIAGKVIGAKSKEFSQGFWQGLKTKGKHDN